MQNTSSLYNQIVTGDHWFENQLVIDGVGTFDGSQIFSMSTDLKMFKGSPSVGQVIAGEINVSMFTPTVEIPTMAVLRPRTRACNATQHSEWLPQGVYFIDTRESTKNNDGLDILTIDGYDALLKTEQDYATTSLTWDALDTSIVSEIATQIGVTVDSRTWSVMTDGNRLPMPTGYTLREYLGYIASMYVGCFIITDEGKLRLVSLLELPPETNYLIDPAGYAITFGGDRILV